jgi:hypothetical protein
MLQTAGQAHDADRVWLAHDAATAAEATHAAATAALAELQHQ